MSTVDVVSICLKVWKSSLEGFTEHGRVEARDL